MFPMNNVRRVTLLEDEVVVLDSSQESIDLTEDDRPNLNVSIHPDLDRTVSLGNPSKEFVLLDEEVDACTSDSKSQISDLNESVKPMVKVMFRDQIVASKYKEKIKDFLQKLISSSTKGGNVKSSKLLLEVWHGDVEDEQSANESVINVSTENDESQDTIDSMLFTIDKEPQLKDDFDVPTYGKKYDKTLQGSPMEPESEETVVRPKFLCFNCMGEHNLRDCTQPRMQSNINKNRKEFNAKKGFKGNHRVMRYHVEEEQKYAHLAPGQLSSRLKKALGVTENELPRHIYRMRKLGYPPGWLEEARLQHSGITLFSSDGSIVADPSAEPGEILEKEDMDRFDVKKIHDFPGFNVPPPPGTLDEHRRYGVPKMQTKHSKEVMLSVLKDKKADEGYKRKKLKRSPDNVHLDTEAVPSEMEIEDPEDGEIESVSVKGLFVPPLPLERLETPPPPPPPPPLPPPPPPPMEEFDTQPQISAAFKLSESETRHVDSPSLEELESAKTKLLAELDNSNSQSTPIKRKSQSMNQEMPPPSAESTPQSVSRNQSIDSSRMTPNTSHGSVKSVDLGTPILQSLSPYSRLPPSEKFSKNICDVINFENLPDATGKYEQMSGIIQKVRVTLAKLQQE
ncbi:zinc finger CCHC domain-containing protein 8 homolog [Orussus abietinus]|uniref:zinc finger CCHC domain-containing protein 8 homolog n=1 Tax=Orussus abietinus TaxID=222816 RepID=UPI000625AD63|nr:zinc finger CCHC domain-containing protein 8 homolog [Orussus abietinus]